MKVYVVEQWHEYNGGRLIGAKGSLGAAQSLARDDSPLLLDRDFEWKQGPPPDADEGETWLRIWSAVIPKTTILGCTETYDIHEFEVEP